LGDKTYITYYHPPLPGSTKAINEYMDEILKSLWHIIMMSNDIDSH
jgi:molybdopterin biosynthesis enzyme MoaB